MSNYTKLVDYAAKDLLLSGDAAKAVKGTEIGAEFDAIATMSATKVDSGGALGTPSSGTLTNCTGLPVAGITDSTTEALGVGSIELGHATDTTITRTGAGAIAVEGVAVLLSGGALGTPSSGTLTNCSGTASSLTAGTATVANGLKSATTTVVVSAATAPSAGQVLTATSSTAAQWSTVTSATGATDVIYATRDLTLAAGSVSYTGFSGTPKAVDIYASVNNSAFSIGSSNVTTDRCLWKNYTTTYSIETTSSIALQTGATPDVAYGQVSSFDANGLTIAWTKLNSPTGTADLIFVPRY